MQPRLDLEGTGDDSAYIDATLFNAKKNLPRKNVHVFLIDAKGDGETNSPKNILDDLETIREGATDLSVSYGERSSVIMEPYRFGDGPTAFEEKIRDVGAFGGTDRVDVPKPVMLVLTEV